MKAKFCRRIPNFFRWARSAGGGRPEVEAGGAWVTATEGSAQAGAAAERRSENSTSSP